MKDRGAFVICQQIPKACLELLTFLNTKPANGEQMSCKTNLKISKALKLW